MTLQRDGSGLEVKRVRGMTLPQYTELAMRYWEEPNKRRAKHSHAAGLLSHVDHARRQIRFTRERRRDRRAKRLAKAAMRRADAMLRRVLSKYGPGIMVVLPSATLEMRTCGPSVVSQNELGATIEYEFSFGTGDKSIVGEVGHALGS